MVMKGILSEMERYSIHRHSVLKAEKKEGKSLVVCTSTYVPTELIKAAGANCYFLCRGGDPAPSQAALDYTLECINPLARATASYIILDGMDDLAADADLVVTAFTDSHMGRMSELMECKGLRVFKLGVPADWQRDLAFGYYLKRLRELSGRLSELTGCPIDEEKAREEFRRSNRIKAVLREINRLRREEPVTLGIETVLRLSYFSHRIADERGEELLAKALEQARSGKPLFDSGAPRLLLAGRTVAEGDYRLMKLLDESGCPVVAEMLDEGLPVLDFDMELEGDLLENFARKRFCQSLPINSFQPAWKIRFSHMEQLIRDYRIDGVVWYQLNYDEIYDMEYACVSSWLRERGIPIIKLETNYDYSPDKLKAYRNALGAFLAEAGKHRGK